MAKYLKEENRKQRCKIGRWVKAYLSLGSNMGDCRANLINAVRTVDETENIRVLNVSSLYRSEPVGMEANGSFLNCAAEIETSLEPLELLDELEKIETLYERGGKSQNRPRTLDIDITMFGELVVSFPRLKIPHPRMAERRFVLEPLAQIAPHLRHPTLKQTLAELAAAVSNQSVFREQIENTDV